MSDKQYHFSLSISAAEYLRFYQGSARNVAVNTHQGLRVRFPASALRPYVTKDGISGQFSLITDANDKLIELRRI